MPPSPKAVDAHSVSVVHGPHRPVETLQYWSKAGGHIPASLTQLGMHSPKFDDCFVQTVPPRQSDEALHPQRPQFVPPLAPTMMQAGAFPPH